MGSLFRRVFDTVRGWGKKKEEKKDERKDEKKEERKAEEKADLVNVKDVDLTEAKASLKSNAFHIQDILDEKRLPSTNRLVITKHTFRILPDDYVKQVEYVVLDNVMDDDLESEVEDESKVLDTARKIILDGTVDLVSSLDDSLEQSQVTSTVDQFSALESAVLNSQTRVAEITLDQLPALESAVFNSQARVADITVDPTLSLKSTLLNNSQNLLEITLHSEVTDVLSSSQLLELEEVSSIKLDSVQALLVEKVLNQATKVLTELHNQILKVSLKEATKVLVDPTLNTFELKTELESSQAALLHTVLDHSQSLKASLHEVSQVIRLLDNFQRRHASPNNDLKLLDVISSPSEQFPLQFVVKKILELVVTLNNNQKSDVSLNEVQNTEPSIADQRLGNLRVLEFNREIALDSTPLKRVQSLDIPFNEHSITRVQIEATPSQAMNHEDGQGLITDSNNLLTVGKRLCLELDEHLTPTSNKRQKILINESLSSESSESGSESDESEEEDASQIRKGSDLQNRLQLKNEIIMSSPNKVEFRETIEIDTVQKKPNILTTANRVTKNNRKELKQDFTTKEDGMVALIRYLEKKEAEKRREAEREIENESENVTLNKAEWSKSSTQNVLQVPNTQLEI